MRVLFLEVLREIPLVEGLAHVFIANVQHGLCVGTSRLLQAPGGRVVKAKTTGTWAAIGLLEVVTNVEARVSTCLSEEVRGSCIVLVDVPGSFPVFDCVLANCFFGH